MTGGLALVFESFVEQASRVEEHPVAPRHQFVELDAGREVLVVEHSSLARFESADDFARKAFFDGGENLLAAGKRMKDRSEAFLDRGRARRPGPKRRPLAGDKIRRLAARAAAPNRQE